MKSSSSVQFWRFSIWAIMQGLSQASTAFPPLSLFPDILLALGCWNEILIALVIPMHIRYPDCNYIKLWHIKFYDWEQDLLDQSQWLYTEPHGSLQSKPSKSYTSLWSSKQGCFMKTCESGTLHFKTHLCNIKYFFIMRLYFFTHSIPYVFLNFSYSEIEKYTKCWSS